MATESFQIGPLEVAPGQRLNGEIPFAKRPDGGTLTIPVIIIHGAKPGPVLCLNSGTHGDEPEGTLAIIDIAEEIDAQNLSGTLVGIPVLNILAFLAKSSLDVSGIRETPIDWKNLARVFPGRADGTVTERLAHTIVTKIIPRMDAVIDFHSGGTRGTSHFITGFVGAEGEIGKKSLELAQLFPLQTLWRVSPWAKFASSCIEQGVPVAVMETSGQGRAEGEDVEALKTGIRNVMRHLGLIDGTIKGIPQDRKCIDTETYIYVKEGGLLRPTVKTGESVQEGQLIGTICDVYGEVNQRLSSPLDGIVTGVRTKPVVWPGEPAFLVANFISLEEALKSQEDTSTIKPP